MQVQPYLNFNGRCEEALEFYRGAVGAEIVMMMRMKENPEPPPPGSQLPGIEDKILHAAFRVGEAMLMASDGRCTSAAAFEGITLSLTVANEAEAARRFAALSEGGQVHMPLARTFFSASFGMLADRFGVPWMVLVQPQ